MPREMLTRHSAECRKPTSCDRLPVHRSESPTGYSSAGCSPAEPASASPVTVNSSSIAIRRGNQIAAQPHCREAVQVALVVSAADASVISTLRAGCHFYLAPTPLLSKVRYAPVPWIGTTPTEVR